MSTTGDCKTLREAEKSEKMTGASPTVRDKIWQTPCGKMVCHIGNKDVEQLHRDAQALGLKRSWFRTKSYPHYDLIGEIMIGRAIARGIKEATRKEFLQIVKEAQEREERGRE